MTEFLPEDRPYIIAEVGGNHGGEYQTALDYVDAAAEAGVDAVKFQIYRAERLIQPDEPPLPLAGDDYDTQFERFKELEFTEEEWNGLVSATKEHDLDFSASVFDPEQMKFVADASPFIKIASGDLTNVPLLRKARELQKPIILSTGFATVEEIERALKELPEERVVLLHCMGSYPTPDEDANLQLIDQLDDQFDVPVGYSDHTVGTLAPTVAMAKGSVVIEKHFTLDKSIEVGDHRLSANPEEMQTLVDSAERVWEMESEGSREASVFECERKIKTNMRRSLATKDSVAEGEVFDESNLTALRPEDGVSPFRYDEVLGRHATRDIGAREILEASDFR